MQKNYVRPKIMSNAKNIEIVVLKNIGLIKQPRLSKNEFEKIINLANLKS